MHGGDDAVRVWWERHPDVHGPVERLHAVDDVDELRLKPDLHRHGRYLGMHVHLVDLPRVGHHLPGWANARDVPGRRQWVPLRVIDVDVPWFGVVFGDVAERCVLDDMHEQLLARADRVRVGGPRDVHAREQRLLVVRDTRCMPGFAPELHRERRFGGVHLQREPV
jgi:hypothetical protein